MNHQSRLPDPDAAVEERYAGGATLQRLLLGEGRGPSKPPALEPEWAARSRGTNSQHPEQTSRTSRSEPHQETCLGEGPQGGGQGGAREMAGTGRGTPAWPGRRGPVHEVAEDEDQEDGPRWPTWPWPPQRTGLSPWQQAEGPAVPRRTTSLMGPPEARPSREASPHTPRPRGITGSSLMKTSLWGPGAGPGEGEAARFSSPRGRQVCGLW